MTFSPGCLPCRSTALGDSDARALLLANVPGPLDARVCDQIVAESHGNPLALIELPRTWNAAGLAGGFGLPSSQPVAAGIEQSYIRRLQLLPPDTRLLASRLPQSPSATLPCSTVPRNARDRHRRSGPCTGWWAARAGGRVEFAHPLVRSAAYRSAAADDRHRVHRALADATVAETDPDRRAWHRARATPGPDEEVAAELERSAGRAQARGGVAAAAAFLQRSARAHGRPGAACRARAGRGAGECQAARSTQRSSWRPRPRPDRSTDSARPDRPAARQLAFALGGSDAAPLLRGPRDGSNRSTWTSRARPT